MKKTINHIVLNTGATMPIVGLGTWKSPKEKAGQAVEYALVAGYRHIDCAAIYLNEKEIGASLKNVFESGKVAREDVFITGKLWNTHHAKNDVAVACKNTLKDLQLDYLDLYLVHWAVAFPSGPEKEPTDAHGVAKTAAVSVLETWRAMEELTRSGLVKAIGVANCTGPMLIDLLTYADIVPAVNQIELHPYLQQTKLVEFCHYKGIRVTAYSPLGTPGNVRGKAGEPILLEDKTVVDLGAKHHKSPAQILIRWAIQRGTVVIPKSTTPANIKANSAVFDFELSKKDMDVLAGLDRKHRFVNPGEWWKLPYFD